MIYFTFDEIGIFTENRFGDFSLICQWYIILIWQVNLNLSLIVCFTKLSNILFYTYILYTQARSYTGVSHNGTFRHIFFQMLGIHISCCNWCRDIQVDILKIKRKQISFFFSYHLHPRKVIPFKLVFGHLDVIVNDRWQMKKYWINFISILT